MTTSEHGRSAQRAHTLRLILGDQLHPDGSINPDTYASIAPAYARIEKLEPYLEGARQVSDVAILTAEYFHPVGARNNHSDDGAAQTVTLVYPAEAEISDMKVSVLTPVGAALIGMVAGQSIAWTDRSERRRELTVIAVA